MRKDEFPIVDKLVKDSINEVLDKIKADIEKAMADFYEYNDYQIGVRQGFRFALEIIDKYRKEQE